MVMFLIDLSCGNPQFLLIYLNVKKSLTRANNSIGSTSYASDMQLSGRMQVPDCHPKLGESLFNSRNVLGLYLTPFHKRRLIDTKRAFPKICMVQATKDSV